MNKKILFFQIFFILFLSGSIFPQNINKFDIKLSHPIGGTISDNSEFDFRKIPDTLKIVAILVQFQEDNTELTTGNGKFDLSNKYYNSTLGRDTVIDSPPYDSSYFADHLLFLKNYYYKSSKGKFNIKTELFGNIITLPKKMQEYSPQKNESNYKLGLFFQDVWSLADNFIDFSNYNINNTAFIIFHAGTGRDIDLSSVLGYDPTPFDIPSIFLGLKSLKEFFGANYNGYTTNEGFNITNSMIIPSTELRELNLLSGKYLLQLGINGILAGSLGSYLGLPDLFNTQTGKTAIGRFGLMDGQSIFSFNGIFPPEPSAWEKIRLGWVEPIVISSGKGDYLIKTSSDNTLKDSTIFKILINSKEYFLIENRNRNPHNLGQKVFMRNRNFVDSILFTKDEAGFVNYDIFKINGNLIDVSYFDWSLPGLINDTANYRGGLLIWHIDENIINANINTNSVNNNINHKGVDLEEAKGSQDIGVTINTPFGPFTSDGSFVDFWYKGYHYVPDNIYKNEFTPTSIPNSLSYSLANNNIFITDIDSASPKMRVKINIEGDFISIIKGYPKYISNGNLGAFSHPIPIDINNDGKDELFVNDGNNNIFAFKNDGSSLTSNLNGLLLSGYGFMPVSSAYSSVDNKTKLICYKLNQQNNSTTLGLFSVNNFSLIDTTSVLFGYPISSPPLIMDSLKIVSGFANGYINEFNLINNNNLFVDTTLKNSINQFTRENQTLYRFASDNQRYKYVGNLSNKNSTDSIYLVNNNQLYLNGRNISLNYNINKIQSLIIADINKDNKQEIIFTDNEKKLYAINSQGILLDYFPFKAQKNITSGISIADIDNDGIFDLIFTLEDGDLIAYNTKGKILNGFPIKVGNSTVSTPAIFNYSDTIGLAVLSGDGYLYAFKTKTPYSNLKVLWKNFLKDKNFSANNYISNYSDPGLTEKLPSAKVYNWPNPVYDDFTFIRYYLNGNATSVKINILNISGELITTLNGTSYSNTDNEIKWDVKTVQSGIYYGVIKAEIDGQTETKIIKIAVVK